MSFCTEIEQSNIWISSIYICYPIINNTTYSIIIVKKSQENRSQIPKVPVSSTEQTTNKSNRWFSYQYLVEPLLYITYITA